MMPSDVAFRSCKTYAVQGTGQTLDSLIAEVRATAREKISFIRNDCESLIEVLERRKADALRDATERKERR